MVPLFLAGKILRAVNSHQPVKNETRVQYLLRLQRKQRLKQIQIQPEQDSFVLLDTILRMVVVVESNKYAPHDTHLRARAVAHLNVIQIILRIPDCQNHL